MQRVFTVMALSLGVLSCAPLSQTAPVAAMEQARGGRTLPPFALRVFNGTLLRINDAYVDPRLVDPQGMLLAALDSIQRQIAEVQVEPSPDRRRAMIRVDTAAREFAIDRVDSPWVLSTRMGEICRFIAESLPPGVYPQAERDIETAATNGILATLDPQSRLLSPPMLAAMMQGAHEAPGVGVVAQVLRAAAGAIGYVRLLRFDAASHEELQRALLDLNRQGIRGLVLDLRGNQGGLLNEAVQSADAFLEAGTIVSLVGPSASRSEERRATPAAQPRLPMAVLVDGVTSAGAEIVAGALQRLDRALILGARTFGNGSMHVLYNNDDGSLLQLTIARLLLAGGIPIQSVGVTPDVALTPVTVDTDHLSLFASSGGRGAPPAERLRYLQSGPATAGGAGFVEDDEIRFARDLLAAAQGSSRPEVLASARDLLRRRQGAEDERIAAALAKLGVDWRPVPSEERRPALEARVTTDRPGDRVHAGETLTFTATVRNAGAGAAGQVWAVLRSDDPLLSDREFVFGKLAPGQTRTWAVPVRVPRDSLTRLDAVRVEFRGEHGAAPPSPALQVRLDGLPQGAPQPLIEVQDAPLVVATPSFHLNATVKCDGPVLDAYVQVANEAARELRKVLYRSNRAAASPGPLLLEGEVPLWPGVNLVTVVARRSPQERARRVLVVTRRDPR